MGIWRGFVDVGLCDVEEGLVYGGSVRGGGWGVAVSSRAALDSVSFLWSAMLV